MYGPRQETASAGYGEPVELTGADPLSPFGEQPLREVHAFFEIGYLPSVHLFELGHLLPMAMFHLRHLIFEAIVPRCGRLPDPKRSNLSRYQAGMAEPPTSSPPITPATDSSSNAKTIRSDPTTSLPMMGMAVFHHERLGGPLTTGGGTRFRALRVPMG